MQWVVAQVVSCVLLEMSLAFLGILCNLLVVTTIRHQVIFLFLLTIIKICSREFAVYGECTQEELQNSTTNLLLINLCFSNLLVSFLVKPTLHLDMKQRSVLKHLEVLEIFWNGEGYIIWNTFSWKGQSWKRVDWLLLQSKLISWKTFVGLFSHTPIYDWAVSFRLAMEPPQSWFKQDFPDR